MPRYKSSPIERAAEQERKENLRNIKKKSFSAKLFVKGICTAYYIVLKLTVSASKASAFVDAFLFGVFRRGNKPSVLPREEKRAERQ